MTKIFVFEYKDDWTTGSLVVRAKDITQADELINGRDIGYVPELKLITDDYTVNCRKLLNKFDFNKVSFDKFTKYITHTLKPDHLSNDILKFLNKTKDTGDYPGYKDNSVRVDWLVDKLKIVVPGIYLVGTFELNKSENSKPKIISDTYNCG